MLKITLILIVNALNAKNCMRSPFSELPLDLIKLTSQYDEVEAGVPFKVTLEAGICKEAQILMNRYILYIFNIYNIEFLILAFL